MVTKLLLALACLSMLSTAALARHLYSRAEQRKACEADAMRLCKDDVPDEKKIIACMQAKQRQLSPTCYRVFKASAPPAG